MAAQWDREPSDKGAATYNLCVHGAGQTLKAKFKPSHSGETDWRLSLVVEPGDTTPDQIMKLFEAVPRGQGRAWSEEDVGLGSAARFVTPSSVKSLQSKDPRSSDSVRSVHRVGRLPQFATDSAPGLKTLPSVKALYSALLQGAPGSKEALRSHFASSFNFAATCDGDKRADQLLAAPGPGFSQGSKVTPRSGLSQASNGAPGSVFSVGSRRAPGSGSSLGTEGAPGSGLALGTEVAPGSGFSLERGAPMATMSAGGGERSDDSPLYGADGSAPPHDLNATPGGAPMYTSFFESDPPNGQLSSPPNGQLGSPSRVSRRDRDNAWLGYSGIGNFIACAPAYRINDDDCNWEEDIEGTDT
ncbi:hypothetical protein FOA52_010303 [Chlamydomonas sp. UWO 241]|nr:hypothetical protein FOA52_010303 [Chlamydomonas sp. UWO 241]